MKVIKMNGNLTIDDILKDFPRLDNINDLLDSDILILPVYRNEDEMAFGDNQPSNVQIENLKIEYYYDDKTKFRFVASAAGSDILILGSIILTSIDIFIQLAGWIKEKYKDKNININCYIKNESNYYFTNTFIGKSSDFENSIRDLNEKMKKK